MKNALHIKDTDNKYKYVCPDCRIELRHKKTLKTSYQVTYISTCLKCKQDFLICD